MGHDDARSSAVGVLSDRTLAYLTLEPEHCAKAAIRGQFIALHSLQREFVFAMSPGPYCVVLAATRRLSGRCPFKQPFYGWIPS